ncbi:MAG TPA: type II secretion system F family protein [Chthonomonas sp.]|jgi:type II secretion system protein F|uniref:type II secretion system F family protein n=1 Tax=Chthonomonas sp. TaxID=2282153 RepID=UPI002B4B3CA6|nr:type II secretion system F family protein [Chthonomonas sp.]HLH79536.1 type II secretion system F family protein [Chthonomonas sp.]
MPEFTYEARDRSGRLTTGVINAQDLQDAAVKVRALGVYPTRILTGQQAANGAMTKKKEAKAAVSSTSEGKKRIGRTQILLFTREMADLLDAGLPMDRAFSTLIEQMESEAIRPMLQSMQADIRAGQPLSEALSKFPREFSTLYINMVRAGEVSGQLPEVMKRLADFMEKEQTRRSQIAAALTYPAVLITVAVGAVTFLLTFVVPKLSGIFHDMGSALPLPTVILLTLSGIIGRYWPGIVVGIALAVFLLRRWLRTETGKRRMDAFLLEMPLFGTLNRKVVASRLARTLGTLLAGGVPILEAMSITASALGNEVAAEAVLNARGHVRQGETLHAALEKSGDFLPVVLHMTAVGEETGRLPSMLLRTAETLDFEVDNTMRRLTSLVEPLVVLLMGAFIGFIVLSILLPIFKANTLVK